MRKKNILVTGAHRTGSTWVGKVMTIEDEIDHFYEPMNVMRKKNIHPVPVDYMFAHIREDAQEQKALKKYLKYLTEGSLTCLYNRWRKEENKPLKVLIREELTKWKRRKHRRLYKDPIALFAAEFFYTEMNCAILVLIRHPAAFALSLKEKGWKYIFSNFLNQKELMDEIIPQYEKPIIDFLNDPSRNEDLIEHAILLWSILYERVRQYRRKHPDWYFIKHETLSLNPIEEFETIFKHFELNFSQKNKDYILNTTRGEVDSRLIRDSKRNSSKWTRQLSKEEIRRVYEGTKEVAADFYSKEEWFGQLT